MTTMIFGRIEVAALIVSSGESRIVEVFCPSSPQCSHPCPSSFKKTYSI